MFKSISLVLLVLLFCLPVAAKEPAQFIDGLVVDVADGDTIHVQDSRGTRIKVRLHGIDAPEVEKLNCRTGLKKREAQAFGKEALQALSARIGGKMVRLEVMETGKKAVVATIWLNKRNINLEMVAHGFAWVPPKHIDQQPAPEFQQAETKARQNRLGLWQQEKPQPPWEFREVQKMKFELAQF